MGLGKTSSIQQNKYEIKYLCSRGSGGITERDEKKISDSVVWLRGQVQLGRDENVFSK